MENIKGNRFAIYGAEYDNVCTMIDNQWLGGMLKHRGANKLVAFDVVVSMDHAMTTSNHNYYRHVMEAMMKSMDAKMVQKVIHISPYHKPDEHRQQLIDKEHAEMDKYKDSPHDLLVYLLKYLKGLLLNLSTHESIGSDLHEHKIGQNLEGMRRKGYYINLGPNVHNLKQHYGGHK